MALVVDHPHDPRQASTARHHEDRLTAAVAVLRSGGPVVLDGGAHGAYLVAAAADADPATVARLVRLGSGFLVAAAPADRLEALDLAPAVGHVQGAHSDYSVPFDARDGISTGISARDRARTLAVLADPASRAADLTRPGHVVATRCAPLGVLERPAPAEAAADLATLAGGGPVAVLTALLDVESGEPLTGSSLEVLAGHEDLVVVTIDDVVAHRVRHDPPLRRAGELTVPTPFGVFTATRFEDRRERDEHVVLTAPRFRSSERGRVEAPALVALLLECRLAALGADGCGCAADRDTALSMAAPSGGVILHLSARGPDTTAARLAGTASSLLAGLFDQREPSRPDAVGSAPDDGPQQIHIRLLRPVSSCHATGEVLAQVATELRGLDVTVDVEVLLGRSSVATAVRTSSSTMHGTGRGYAA